MACCYLGWQMARLELPSELPHPMTSRKSHIVTIAARSVCPAPAGINYRNLSIFKSLHINRFYICGSDSSIHSCLCFGASPKAKDKSACFTNDTVHRISVPPNKTIVFHIFTYCRYSASLSVTVSICMHEYRYSLDNIALPVSQDCTTLCGDYGT